MSPLYTKKARKSHRQDFLLSFFSKPNINSQVTVNGFVLNRYHNNGTNKWEVMIYTQESWDAAQRYVLLNKPQKIKDSKRKQKFADLFSELNTAVNRIPNS